MAAHADELPKRKLLIGTKVAPPFSMKDENGAWQGISIDLWREIARQMGVDYEFKETDLKGLLDGVGDSTLDASIAAISMTPEREAICDFSHPYYNSGLGIAVRPSGKPKWTEVLMHFLSWDVLKVLLLLTLSLVVVGALMWLVEHKRNHSQFGGEWTEGIGSGVWWSAVTLTTVGYGDKAPVTLIGRVLALLWMFSAIIIVASFTATMTTSMTITQLESSIKGPQDLEQVRVGTVANATGENYLRSREIKRQTYPTPLDGLRALAEGKIDAMVYDAPILRYFTLQNFPDDVSVLPITFEKQSYGIALPTQSPLREPINTAILAELKTKHWQEVLRRYLGD